MRSFQLEKPILNAIKVRVNQAITDGQLPSGSDVKYLPYEPDEGYIHVCDHDGAICVFSPLVDFASGNVGNDGEAESDSDIVVYAFGFGDPIPKGESLYDPTVQEAVNRAQALITLAYQAIMDKRVIFGGDDIPKNYGVSFNILERNPVKIEKFQTLGTTDVRRGFSGFKGTFRFKLEEISPEESLGELYAGTDNLKTDSENPGE